MQYLLSILLLFSIQFSFAKKKNIVFEFEPQIEQLISLSDSLFYANTIMGKINANNEFKQVLRSILKDSTSIQYDFSRVKCLSVLNDPRGKFRLYTWTLKTDNADYDYFGFTQYQRKRKKSILGAVKIENFVFELTNKSNEIGDNEYVKLDSSNWYGCVYYNIVPAPKSRDHTYILIGWDGFGYRSTKKIIETFKFNSKGQISFGYKIIRYNEGRVGKVKVVSKARLIFEYNGQVSVTVNFNNNLEMIVFDHLSPANPALASLKFTYAPDFTYDALKYEKKKWIHRSDIDVRNREEVKAVKWKPKDIKGRTAETLIPER
tara:strand:- start:48 stop:1004 length:957 start_codon:yes stop_codon:yes gene_type:complete